MPPRVAPEGKDERGPSLVSGGAGEGSFGDHKTDLAVTASGLRGLAYNGS